MLTICNQSGNNNAMLGKNLPVLLPEIQIMSCEYIFVYGRFSLIGGTPNARNCPEIRDNRDNCITPILPIRGNSVDYSRLTFNRYIYHSPYAEMPRTAICSIHGSYKRMRWSESSKYLCLMIGNYHKTGCITSWNFDKIPEIKPLLQTTM